MTDAGCGLRLVLVGIEPDFRLPLEGYYAFLALKNGVPVSYGGGWELFGALDFAINVFPSFRQGESPYLATQLLRAYRWVFGMRTVVIDRYQLGHESTEALRSGSFYFYHRLGFRPRDPGVVRTLAAERAKIVADSAYRSPVPALKRLAAAEVFLTLPGGHPAPESRVRATDVSALVARYVAREFGGDRARAMRESADRVGRLLGARRRSAWPPGERRAFERLSPVIALIPDLAARSTPERHALLAAMLAKGGGTEMEYARRLNGHRRLRRSLEAPGSKLIRYHYQTVLAAARKFSLDKHFQYSLWFQQMLKSSEQEKGAEIRGSSKTGGAETAGASAARQGLAGEH